MRVLVTRPVREAHSWLQALTGAGHDPVALPLIEIAPAPDLHALQSAWQRIGRYQVAMFVSGNAVDSFFAAKPANIGIPFGDGGLPIRAWATGPGTARALARAGFTDAQIDAPKPDSLQFDSESLWAEVRSQVNGGSKILIVRGEDAGVEANGAGSANVAGNGRDWIAQRIDAVGGSVDFLVVYRRQMPVFTPEQLRQVRAASSDGSVWLFSSSQAVANLAGSFPGQSWAQARAVATHPRIAQTVRDHGFGVVCQSRPTLADVVASIESLA